MEEARADLKTIEYIIDRAQSDGDTVEFDPGDWETLQDTVSRLRERLVESPPSLQDEFMAWLDEKGLNAETLTQREQAGLAAEWASQWPSSSS